jgi:hypothetical protein
MRKIPPSLLAPSGPRYRALARGQPRAANLMMLVSLGGAGPS